MCLTDGVGACAGDEAALMQDQQIVAGLYFVQQVRGPQHADALVAQLADVLVQGQPAGRVKTNAGFIEQ